MDRERLGFALRRRIYMNIGSAGRVSGEICSFLQSLRFPLNVSMILIIAYFRIICCWKFEHIPFEKEGEYMDIQNVIQNDILKLSANSLPIRRLPI